MNERQPRRIRKFGWPAPQAEHSPRRFQPPKLRAAESARAAESVYADRPTVCAVTLDDRADVGRHGVEAKAVEEHVSLTASSPPSPNNRPPAEAAHRLTPPANVFERGARRRARLGH